MLTKILFIAFFAGGALFGLLLWREVKTKHVMNWLPAYIRQKARPKHNGLTHVMFCFVDHYEPKWNKVNIAQADARVETWYREYPEMAKQFKDSDGKSPQHSFFFPQEEYEMPHLEKLSGLCAEGFGEIEVHIHHDKDTEAGLVEKLTTFIDLLHKTHGALPLDPKTGKPSFCFIHGNWALDNSAGGHHCGVNNELQVLSRLGCYADMTFPSAPSATQPPTINTIYYAEDDPHAPRSHDYGVAVKVGGTPSGDLLMIPGTLGLNWRMRKFGIIPKIENGEIRDSSPPSASRVDSWIKENIHIEGRPDWIFIKIHTHGTQEGAKEALLGKPIREMHRYLTTKYNDGKDYALHYVSAREMFNIVKAAEAGHSGNPNGYRDFILKRPDFKHRSRAVV